MGDQTTAAPVSVTVADRMKHAVQTLLRDDTLPGPMLSGVQELLGSATARTAWVGALAGAMTGSESESKEIGDGCKSLLRKLVDIALTNAQAQGDASTAVGLWSLATALPADLAISIRQHEVWRTEGLWVKFAIREIDHDIHQRFGVDREAVDDEHALKVVASESMSRILLMMAHHHVAARALGAAAASINAEYEINVDWHTVIQRRASSIVNVITTEDLAAPKPIAERGLLRCERLVWRLSAMVPNPYKDLEGTLFLTNYRFWFVGSGATICDFSVPLAMLSKVATTVVDRGVATLLTILLTDRAIVRIITDASERHLENLFILLRKYCSSSLEYERSSAAAAAAYSNPAPRAFAFLTAPAAATGTAAGCGAGEATGCAAIDALPADGWSWYDKKAEWARQGVVGHPAWRLTSINDHYGICDSYPKLLVVPAGVVDEDLTEIMQFRSKGRVPVLTWRDRESGAGLLRSSQPKVGFLHKRSKSDEAYMAAAGVRWIFDARPLRNAIGNMAMGKGYEQSDSYTTSNIVFLDIENIHVMRDSLQRLAEAIVDAGNADLDEELESNEASISEGLVAAAEEGVKSTSAFSWLLAVDNCKWLHHIQSVLSGVHRIVKALGRGDTALIHCSDGWDRTSQLSALAQLMLDPYYRTIHGFVVLIEKDWLSFGHMFGLRCGHMSMGGSDEEQSPVFLQFLDCVWQLTRQYPASFQFNEHFLQLIAEAAYSCQYGTFLFNNEQERQEAKVVQRTASAWSAVKAAGTRMVNPSYRQRDGTLVPRLGMQRLAIWPYYMRYVLVHRSQA